MSIQVPVLPSYSIFVQSKSGDSSSETSLPARGAPTPWSKDWQLITFTDYLGKSQLNEWAPEAKNSGCLVQADLVSINSQQLTKPWLLDCP